MRLGFLSDAHGNLAGFRRAVDLLRERGVDEIHCLGDSVGYLLGLQVVDALMSEGIESLAGNHEAMLLKDNVDQVREDVYRLRPTRAALAEPARKQLTAWPHSRKLRRGGLDIHLFHGSPGDPCNGYVYPDSDLSVFKRHPAGFVLLGHTHRPFIRHADDKIFVNVGSCGLPRDDGRFGCTCILDTEEPSAQLLRFDIEAELQQAFQDFGPVHPSVERLLERRAPTLVGTVVSS